MIVNEVDAYVDIITLTKIHFVDFMWLYQLVYLFVTRISQNVGCFDSDV